MRTLHRLKSLQQENEEHFLLIMPAPGEKFHGLAKNFFGLSQASAVFPPPINLRIETGVL